MKLFTWWQLLSMGNDRAIINAMLHFQEEYDDDNMSREEINNLLKDYKGIYYFDKYGHFVKEGYDV